MSNKEIIAFMREIWIFLDFSNLTELQKFSVIANLSKQIVGNLSRGRNDRQKQGKYISNGIFLMG